MHGTSESGTTLLTEEERIALFLLGYHVVILRLARPFGLPALAWHRRVRVVTPTATLRCPAPLRPSPDSCPVVRRMRLTLTDSVRCDFRVASADAKKKLRGFPQSRDVSVSRDAVKIAVLCIQRRLIGEKRLHVGIACESKWDQTFHILRPGITKKSG
jgi:hypothetical protein